MFPRVFPRSATRLRWVRAVSGGLACALLASMLNGSVYEPADPAGHGAPPVITDRSAARGAPVSVKPRAVDPAAAAATKPAAVEWPAPGIAELDLSNPNTVRLGGLAVSAKPMRSTQPANAAHHPLTSTARSWGTDGDPPGKLRVETLGRAASATVGIDGPVLRIGGTETDSQGSVQVTLEYRRFAEAYGGDYGGRLRLLRLPDCALDTSETIAEATRCPAPEVLPAVNNGENKTLVAALDLTRTSYFALAATEESAQGDYSATKLSPSAQWTVNPSSGGLNWTYPIRTPPVPGGFGPQVTLSYSSQTVDGRTAATNNQGSGFGEGFTYEPGYIERRYKPCRDDGHTGVGDQCWARQNATLVLGGRASELVRINDNEWKLSADDGSKVERLLGGANGDNDGEYWKVTTADGIQYFLGLNRLPGWSDNKEETNSVWTVPVYGDDADEPCYKTTFADAYCDQAWRWNLDYVKDTHDNVIAYFYDRETNYYARGGRTDINGAAYHRAGYLKRIDYGLRHNAVYTSNAPARLQFVTAERCLPSDSVDCDPADLNTQTGASWPDVPYDRNCAADTHCGIQQGAPTFWSRKRYVEIRTEIRSGNGWSGVDSWALTHLFTDNADGSKTLWLSKITHTGLVGGTASIPSVELQGIQLPNRVDRPGDNIAPLIRFRLAAVYTDAGAQLDVTYEPADCAADNLPPPGESTRRCFPVKWHPSDSLTEPITDWFHKYVVRQVVETDRTGRGPDMVTRYEYLGAAGWRRTLADGITEDKYRTWSDWRGYETVRVTRGDGQTMTTRTDQTFFRGMNGDEMPGGGTRSASVTDSTGQPHVDAPELVGLQLEQVEYNGAAVVGKSIATPWLHTTYTQSETWGTRRSTFVRPATIHGFTALDTGGWRETNSTTSYDTTYGRVTEVDNLGDLATAADDQCTRSWYSDNTDAWIVSRVNRVETVAVACATTPDRRTQVIDDQRTYFDGLAFGDPATKGDITKQERLASHTGSAATYAMVSERTYDEWGRELTAKDASGATTTTTYTQTDGLLTARSVTNALGHTGTEEYAPAWGAVTTRVDANGERIDLTYDPLGRLAAVWLADRSKADGITPSVKYTYYNRIDAVVAVRTETVETDGTYEIKFELYDGHLRPRQTQKEGPDGGRLITDTFYTATGKTAKTNAEYYAAGAPSDTLINVNDGAVDGQTRYLYDGADRITAEIMLVAGEEKWRTVTTYGGDRVSVDPPSGAVPTTTLLDAREQPVELWQYKGSGPSGEYDRIQYEYTPAGQLAVMTDAAGNVRRYTYDQRGRLMKSEDPNSGTTEFGYDEMDRPTSTKDERGIKVSTSYDAVGRKSKEFAGEPDVGTLLRSWTYDSVYKGQLYSAISYVDGKAYGVAYPTRDHFYRPLLTRYVIPDHAGTELKGVYEFTSSYNRDGTLQAMGYPAGGDLAAEGITYNYDALERPTGMTGATTYVTSTSYAQTGALLQVGLNTGGKNASLTWTYEEGTNRLVNFRVDRQDAPVVDIDATYRYDDAGNILSIADTPDGGQRDIQCYTYDWQRRLTDAWTSTSTATDPCAGGPNATGIGGPAPYHHSYGYDAAGNRTSETEHGLAGASDTTRQYTYPTGGQSQPNALTQVTEDAPDNDSTYTYTYDGAGNTIVRDLAGRRQTLDWDADGHLAAVHEGSQVTSFVYDADGNRILRKEPGATTVYLPGMELRLDHSTHKVLATRYYSFGGQIIALRTASGVKFLASDHQATTHASIDATTGALIQRRTTPFGELRGSSVTWPSDRGFVGGVHDPGIDLIHLGAREYDPSIGRFISTDPIINHSNPQQLEGYSYADNSPVTFSDPNGLQSCPDGDCRSGKSGGDKSTLHNLILVISAIFIMLYMQGLHFNGEVTMDLGEGGTRRNTIPGAKRDGSGKDGVADIIFWGQDVVYVWEVKPGNTAGREMGEQQVARYVEKLQADLKAKGDPRRVEFGPAIVFVDYFPIGNGRQAKIWSEPRNPASRGLIFYGTKPAPTGTPPPASVPVEAPHPVPTPAPVPGTQPAPQPHAVPNPTPGPCGNGLACPRPDSRPGWLDHPIDPRGIIWGAAIGAVAGICLAATVGICGIAIGGGFVVAQSAA